MRKSSRDRFFRRVYEARLPYGSEIIPGRLCTRAQTVCRVRNVQARYEAGIDLSSSPKCAIVRYPELSNYFHRRKIIREWRYSARPFPCVRLANVRVHASVSCNVRTCFPVGGADTARNCFASLFVTALHKAEEDAYLCCARRNFYMYHASV